MLKFMLATFFLVFSIEATEDRVTSEERLNLAKQCYHRDKEFKNDTAVPELWTHYNRDKIFIERNIAGRVNEEAIKDELNALDDFVKNNFTENLSFIDYATIGYYWANILNYGPFLEENNPEKINENIEAYRGAFSRTQNELNTKGELQCAGTPISELLALPLVHVSKQGLLPIFTLNEGLGFFDDHHLPRLALFFGVGTNHELSFDGFLKQNSLELFKHDQAHAQYATQFFLKAMKVPVDRFWQYVTKISALQEEMKKSLNTSEYHQAQMAFFRYFHEGNYYEILTNITDFSYQMSRYEMLLENQKLMDAEILFNFGRNKGRRAREIVNLVEYFNGKIGFSEDLVKKLGKIDNQIHEGKIQEDIYYLNSIYNLSESLASYPKKLLSKEEIEEAALYVEATYQLYKGYKILNRFTSNYLEAGSSH
ncbi:MAG: hypothetical protein ACRYGR_03335 [Janthinobacterium lividum]